MKISDKAIRYIITHYTREAGVRNLEREIANLCRKVAKYIAEGKKKKFYITPQKVSKFLGAPKYLPEEELKKKKRLELQQVLRGQRQAEMLSMLRQQL